MLVLTRKSQQAVVVSPDGVQPIVKVTVLDIFAGRVRLGFEADGNTVVHRWEVWQRIQGSAWPSSPTGNSAASAAC